MLIAKRRRRTIDTLLDRATALVERPMMATADENQVLERRLATVLPVAYVVRVESTA